MQSQHVIFNGKLILEKDASLGINDLSIVRGYGIFDYFKTVNNHPIFIEDNLDRFFKSANLMNLPINFSREELHDQIQQLIDINNIPNSGIKLLLTGGYSTDGYSIATPNLIITQHPFSSNIEQEKNGMKLHLIDFHRAFPHIKSIDYVMGIQALREAKSKGADDVLYYQNDLISECPRANFFLITKNNTILTPGANVLEGITRKHIIEMVKEKFEIETRAITIQDLINAKEAFITSTTKNITPIKSIINQKDYGHGAGPITLILQKMLHERILSQLK